MAGHLRRFLQAARERVAAGFYDEPGPRLPSNGSLRKALLSHPTPILAELKPSSPSEGRLLDRPARLVLHAYKEGGAAALSVLTDPAFFDGSLDLLRQAHATGLPTLMKDFVVDGRQLDAAVRCGASAVLLVERCFPDAPARERLVQAAHARGLEVLLEVFDVADWDRAKASQADLVGVNARDLDTLRVDTAGARRLLAAIAKARPAVALSGIEDRAGYRQAREAGACAALVGTALLRSPDPALVLKGLQRPIAKVCGLRTLADVEAAAEAGADMAGFVVGSPRSPRNLTPAAAQPLVEAARARGVRAVLVTDHADPAEVRDWCRLVRPDFVQVHSFVVAPDWERSLRLVPTHVLQAVRPGEEPGKPGWGLVLDASLGHGKALDAGAAARSLAQPSRFSLVAGGLTPETAALATRQSGAWGADASSGLESAPGVKDPARILGFVQAVHAA